MSGRFVESEIVIGRAWRVGDDGDVLWEERFHNTYLGGLTMGPYSFPWVFEVERAGKRDQAVVGAGQAMTWEPILP